MKRYFIAILLMTVLVAGCAQAKTAEPGTGLKISGGSISKTYTVEQLQALGAAQATFREVAYTGVPLAALLADAGFDMTAVKAVKVVASDGFTVNYEPALFNKTDTLLAYGRADGPLAEEDGIFRMVLPDQEGKLNPRQVVEIQVVQ